MSRSRRSMPPARSSAPLAPGRPELAKAGFARRRRGRRAARFFEPLEHFFGAAFARGGGAVGGGARGREVVAEPPRLGGAQAVGQRPAQLVFDRAFQAVCQRALELALADRVVQL